MPRGFDICEEDLKEALALNNYEGPSRRHRLHPRFWDDWDDFVENRDQYVEEGENIAKETRAFEGLDDDGFVIAPDDGPAAIGGAGCAFVLPPVVSQAADAAAPPKGVQWRAIEPRAGCDIGDKPKAVAVHVSARRSWIRAVVERRDAGGRP